VERAVERLGHRLIAVSPVRFLRSAGALPVWAAFVYAAIAIYGVAEAAVAGRSESAVYLWLFLLPIAAGTGLLTIAREGRLDLLFGAGVTRGRLWQRALLVSVAVPAGIGLLLSPLTLQHVTLVAAAAQALRFLGVAVFTGSVAFAAGLLQPRYAAGVVWLALRLAVLLSRWALDVVALVRNTAGVALPPAKLPKLAAALLLFPELLLEPRLPNVLLILPATIGVLAIFISHRIFLAADFGGRRRAA
jgi:hypothetical protein